MSSAFIDNKRPGVNHYVRDLKQASEWYKEMLGFEIGPHEYNSFVEMYMDGEYIFHLTPAGERIVPHPVPVFWFSSRDIEQTYAILQAKGVEVGPMSWYPDYSSFTFHDLDGNAVAITQHFEIRVKVLEELLLVGIRVVCPQESNYVTAIPQAAHELKLRLHEIPHADNPQHLIAVFKGGDCSIQEEGYWVCIRVEKFGDIPAGMNTLIVPPQRYAVKWHYGHRSEVSRSYQKMHNLILEAGYELNSQTWNIEIARNWGKQKEEEIELDLYEAIV